MEIEKEVKTFEVNLKCPDCEMVMIRYNNTSKEIYKYVCSRCGSSIKSDIKYPYLKYIAN